VNQKIGLNLNSCLYDLARKNVSYLDDIIIISRYSDFFESIYMKDIMFSSLEDTLLPKRLYEQLSSSGKILHLTRAVFLEKNEGDKIKFKGLTFKIISKEEQCIQWKARSALKIKNRHAIFNPGFIPLSAEQGIHVISGLLDGHWINEHYTEIIF
jgi:hypothetical protein